MTDQLNIYQKLAEVRKKVPYLQKGQRSNQYSYVGSSDVLSALNKEINKVGLILKPEIVNAKVSETHEQRWLQDKVKKEPIPTDRVTYFTELEMLMTWINIDNPKEKVICNWYAQGVDIAGEKGVGKALTYGEKYFLLKFFNIATDNDDPDKYQKEQLKKTAINDRQIDTLNALINQVAELAGQEFEAVKTFAINAAKINPKKLLDEYTAYDYGVLAKVLGDWSHAYQAKAKEKK